MKGYWTCHARAHKQLGWNKAVILYEITRLWESSIIYDDDPDPMPIAKINPAQFKFTTPESAQACVDELFADGFLTKIEPDSFTLDLEAIREVMP